MKKIKLNELDLYEIHAETVAALVPKEHKRQRIEAKSSGLWDAVRLWNTGDADPEDLKEGSRVIIHVKENLGTKPFPEVCEVYKIAEVKKIRGDVIECETVEVIDKVIHSDQILAVFTEG